MSSAHPLIPRSAPLLLLVSLAGCADPPAPAPEPAPSPPTKALDFAAGTDRAVILQGFHWASHREDWWRVVAERAPAIAAAGFDMVWLPPSSRSAEAAPQGYLPNELYTQSGAYGDERELRGAIDALHRAGVQVLADIVINHRVGTYDWGDFALPEWGPEAVCGDDEWPRSRGNGDTGAGYHAARDIDHTQPWVRQSLIDWMTWLRDDIGYDGWRFDYVKGYGAQFVGEYVQATRPTFAVGEWWTDLDLNAPDAHRQQLMGWIDGTDGDAAAFDFTTKGILQQAVRHGEYWRLRDGTGRPPGAIGWWPGRSVTFIDNHDTGPSPLESQDHWPFPADEIMQGYAYILTHPGIPTVYWVHHMDWGLGDAIGELMRLREAHGVHAESAVRIMAADNGRYAAIVDERLAVKIGPGQWSPGEGWQLGASGRNYAVWHLDGGGQEPEPAPEPAPEPEPEPGPEPGPVRTVIYMHKETRPGQDIYIRGGHDIALVEAGHAPSADEPITWLNTLNATTRDLKRGDSSLDWFGDSALDWTTDVWPAEWGAEPRYAIDGYGTDPENVFGRHYWKFDVEMTGEAGQWFEFKAFLREGDRVEWEPDIEQAGTPHATRNHWARKGHITVVTFGEDGVRHIPLD